MRSHLLVALSVTSIAAAGTAQRIATEAAEPNDTFLTASAYGCGFHARGEVQVAGDRDWWVFTVGAPSDITLFTGRGRAGSITDTIIDLLDDTGAVIASNDDARGLFSVIGQTVPAGTYYAVVRGFSTRTGTYTLDLSCAPASTGPVVLLEGPENNGDPFDPVSPGIPTPAACGDLFNGAIDVAGDADWYEFTIASAEDVTLATNAGASPVLGDTTLRLHDSTGTEIAFDDDGGPGLYSLITMTALPAGTYYADVRAFSSATGGYSLEITCGAGPVVVSADWTDNGGGCGNVAIAARSLEVPLVGTTFCLDISGVVPGNAGVTVMGYNNTMTPNGVPLPIDLSVYGATGCSLDVEPFETLLFIADASGEASWCVYIPYNTAFIGAQFYQQALAFDAAANAAGFETSNWGLGTVGDTF